MDVCVCIHMPRQKDRYILVFQFLVFLCASIFWKGGHEGLVYLLWFRVTVEIACKNKQRKRFNSQIISQTFFLFLLSYETLFTYLGSAAPPC